jgi:hypothetical protein
MVYEQGDFEVVVNDHRSSGTYSDFKLAVEIAPRLSKTNAPNVITVRSISTRVTVWPAPDPA